MPTPSSSTSTKPKRLPKSHGAPPTAPGPGLPAIQLTPAQYAAEIQLVQQIAASQHRRSLAETTAVIIGDWVRLTGFPSSSATPAKIP